MKNQNNIKLFNYISKQLQLLNQDEMLADCLFEVISSKNQHEHEKNILVLYGMGKAKLNKFLKQALLKSIPNDFPNVFMNIERGALEVIEEQDYNRKVQEDMKKELAECAKLDAIADAKEKTLQIKNKKFIASLSKEQKKVWKELNYHYTY